MPALVMRGRYLMREYWSDTDLFTKLNADQRELYVGLWMLCDDDGWIPRDVAGIGAALYRFLDLQPRSVLVRDGLARLGRLGKVESYRCGCLFLPAVAKYPRAGKKSTEHYQAHAQHFKPSQTDSKGFEPIQTDLKPSPVLTRPDPSLPVVARENGAKPKEGTGGLKERFGDYTDLVKSVVS